MSSKRGGLGKGLGKGLDSLIPVGVLDQDILNASEETQNQKTEISTQSQLLVKIAKIEPNREQPRKKFNEEGLQELADSIKLYGVIQPLLVMDKGDHYEIIAGERRWRAAQMAGLKEVPVIVRNYTKQEIMEIALIENIQREDLNPIEEASAYRKLVEEFHVKHEEIAERVSKSRAFITNSMRLLKLSEPLQQMLIDGQLTSGHARALLSLDTEEEQDQAAKMIVEQGLSVRETENLVKKIQKNNAEDTGKTDSDENEEQSQLFYDEIEKKLSAQLFTRVHIKNLKKNRGKIEIEYYSLEELERIENILERSRQ